MKERLFLLQRNSLLLLAGIPAGISCFFVYRETSGLSLPDLRMPALLFSVALAVTGMRESGVPERFFYSMLRYVSTPREISGLLTLLSFFLSLFLPGEAVISMLGPFSIMILSRISNAEALLIHTLVLEGLAANIAAMLNPLGNAQNLYLFVEYGYSLPAFAGILFPVVFAGLLFLLLSVLTFRRTLHASLTFEKPGCGVRTNRAAGLLYLGLYGLCLLSLFSVLPPLLLLCLSAAVLFYDRKMLKKTELRQALFYLLLLLLAGNLGRLPSVIRVVQQLLQGREGSVTLLFSVFLGGGPAAVLLSPFTTNGRGLIAGSNLGSLGLPTASMAGIRGLLLYQSLRNTDKRKFLFHFLWMNVQLLLVSVFIARFTGNL